MIKSILNQFIRQYGGQLFKQVYLTGPGGPRFADFVITMGNRLVIIETKTNFPLGGSTLARLGGQLQTFLNPSLASVQNSLGGGQAVETIVVTMEAVTQLETSFVAAEAKLATGTLSGVLQGSNQLIMALRAILLGI